VARRFDGVTSCAHWDCAAYGEVASIVGSALAAILHSVPRLPHAPRQRGGGDRSRGLGVSSIPRPGPTSMSRARGCLIASTASSTATMRR
jgi:hypothetical protein